MSHISARPTWIHKTLVVKHLSVLHILRVSITGSANEMCQNKSCFSKTTATEFSSYCSSRNECVYFFLIPQPVTSNAFEIHFLLSDWQCTWAYQDRPYLKPHPSCAPGSKQWGLRCQFKMKMCVVHPRITRSGVQGSSCSSSRLPRQ